MSDHPVLSRVGAQSAVTVSALVVGATFAYRKLVEPTTGKQESTASFVTGFFFLYVGLSVLAMAAPEVGGMFAVLVMVGDLLTNGKGIVNDLNGTLHRTTTVTRGG